jgi:acetyl esterase
LTEAYAFPFSMLSCFTERKEKNHMSLNPQAQAYLERLAAFKMPPIHTLVPEQLRQGMRMQLAQSGAQEPIAHVADRTIPGPTSALPIRIYTPEGSGPFPILVFFHGGGFVIGDLDTHDGVCRRLANGAGCIIVSVDYPLAPEHTFPAAPNAGYAATQWVARHAVEFNGDASRIALGGDSAGGNLATVVAQMVRDQGGPALVFQLMIYPDTDFRRETPSVEAYAGKYGNITKEDHAWFTKHYLNSAEEIEHPYASPLLAPSLRGLPPALIITAEYDTMRDEGEQYGQRLKEAGVPVTVTRYQGMVHEFVRQPFEQSKQALAECAAALQTAFTRVPASPQ